MSTELRDKLRRLGVHKGAAKIQRPPRERKGRAGGIESLVDGRLIDTPYGPTFVHEDVFPIEHAHGRYALGELLRLSPAAAAQIANIPALAEIDLGHAAFIDTETTGLSGGTGTLAFLVGVGVFHISRSAFVIHQFFLRTPAEEPAMLHALYELLDDFQAVVSFNGRGFDLPLLESRFTLARLRPRILRAPHLDLLMPARRVWRGRLPSCALSSLEHHVLDVRREQADVPGFLIPEMYVNYVRSGDAAEMPRVLYHNALDILSMVSLSTRLITLFTSAGETPAPVEAPPGADDLLALGKWYDDLGRTADAEATLRACLAAQPEAETRAAALHRLGYLLKRLDRHTETVRVWEALSESQTRLGIDACVELAKYYEWRDINIERAAVWTQEAVDIIAASPESYEREQIESDLAHRLKRLNRKRREVC